MDDEWVTTRDAEKLKKVGLVQRSITRKAVNKQIEAEKRGGKWWVKVRSNDNRWDLVYRMPPVPTAQAVIEQPSNETGQESHLMEHFY